jgi:hypothetical protein
MTKNLAQYAAPSNALVVRADESTLTSTADIQKLQLEREAHRHKTIWTKDSHGGPYRKESYVAVR